MKPSIWGAVGRWAALGPGCLVLSWWPCQGPRHPPPRKVSSLEKSVKHTQTRGPDFIYFTRTWEQRRGTWHQTLHCKQRRAGWWFWQAWPGLTAVCCAAADVPSSTHHPCLPSSELFLHVLTSRPCCFGCSVSRVSSGGAGGWVLPARAPALCALLRSLMSVSKPPVTQPQQVPAARPAAVRWPGQKTLPGLPVLGLELRALVLAVRSLQGNFSEF